MLTNKQIIAHLLDEYGSLDSAMFDSTGDGICLECGNTQSGVEPDAEDYPCNECNADAVCGIEGVITTYL
jgi:hypothetical protein